MTYFIENTMTSNNWDNIALYCNISGGNAPQNITWIDERNQTVADLANSTYLDGGSYLILTSVSPTVLITKTFRCRVTFPGTNIVLDNSTRYSFNLGKCIFLLAPGASASTWCLAQVLR